MSRCDTSLAVQALNSCSLEAVVRYRDSTLETDPQTFNLVTFLSDPPADGITRTDGSSKIVSLICRLDTAFEVECFLNGGILHYVLRNRLH